MTLFVGALALEPHRDVPDQTLDLMVGHLSRHPDDRPVTVRKPGFALAYVDFDHRETTCAVFNNKRISVLAGDPLLSPRNDGSNPRQPDLSRLHESGFNGDRSALTAARGAFCQAQVDLDQQLARLTADKLGLRPLYFGEHSRTLYFATTLRALLRVCPELGKRADLTAQSQIAALGFALGARTPYADIRVVEAGHQVEYATAGPRAAPYFTWDEIEEQTEDERTFSKRLHDAFVDAVAARLGPERDAVAFLSGGLDSRCVVSALRHLGRTVHTINFAPAGSVDHTLGRMAADGLKTHHFELNDGSLDFWERMVESFAQWRNRAGSASELAEASRVWTGFAGDTVLAPTNITENMVAALRAQRVDAAIDDHLGRVGGRLSPRLFAPGRGRQILDGFRQSLHDELARRTGADPAQRFRVHQLVNEARGNLAGHFEHLDLRRLDFVMPFYDAQVVSLALSCPIDRVLRHRFYYRWLQDFQSPVAEIPWQTYPWSLPCPHPLPRGLRSQWPSGWYDRKARRAELRLLLSRTRSDLASGDFPETLLNRPAIAAAYALARLGVTRYTYLLHGANIFVRYAARSSN